MAGIRANREYVPGFGLGALLPLLCIALGLTCMNVLHGALLRRYADAAKAKRVTKRTDICCLLAAIVLGAVLFLMLRLTLETPIV